MKICTKKNFIKIFLNKFYKLQKEKKKAHETTSGT